jgi:hypothetical protein
MATEETFTVSFVYFPLETIFESVPGVTVKPEHSSLATVWSFHTPGFGALLSTT